MKDSITPSIPIIQNEQMREDIEEDRRSIASSGILYRREPVKTKEELHSIEKHRKREKDVNINIPS
jgi:hypothetical protein